MIRKTIAPIALVLVLGALPASADHRSGDRGRHHRHESSFRSEQLAKIDRHEQRIERLAVRLDHATSELFDEAVTRSRHRSPREWRAIRALRRLERRADAYATTVSERGAGSRRTRIAFEDLEAAHRDAIARCEDLRNPRRLRGEFRRVGELMEKLDRRIAKLDELERRRRHARHRESGRHEQASADHGTDRRGVRRDTGFWLSSRNGESYVAIGFGF